jgi:hypothetical protein
MGEIYESAIKRGLGAMKYVPSFIRVGSGMQILKGGFKNTQCGDRICTFIFQNKEIRLNWVNKLVDQGILMRQFQRLGCE